MKRKTALEKLLQQSSDLKKKKEKENTHISEYSCKLYQNNRNPSVSSRSPGKACYHWTQIQAKQNAKLTHSRALPQRTVTLKTESQNNNLFSSCLRMTAWLSSCMGKILACVCMWTWLWFLAALLLGKVLQGEEKVNMYELPYAPKPNSGEIPKLSPTQNPHKWIYMSLCLDVKAHRLLYK